MAARPQSSFIPYRMRADVAAEFCGEAVATFKEKVADGRFPRPAWREGRNVYWRSSDLVAAMEEGAAVDETIKAPKLSEVDKLRLASG